MTFTSTHLFAGGGGDLRGFYEAGFEPITAVNHDEPATQTLRRNWPSMRVLRADTTNLAMTGIAATDTLAASPICWEVCRNGGRRAPKRQLALELDEPQGSGPAPAREFSLTRSTAYDIIRATEAHRFKAVVCENVPEFACSWDLFDWWVTGFGHLGYEARIVSAAAAHLDGPGNPAAPQLRNRIIVFFIRRDLKMPDLRVTPRAVCERCGEVRGIQQWSNGQRRHIGFYGPNYRYVCPNRRCGHLQVEPVVPAVRDILDMELPAPLFGDGHSGGTPYVASTRARVQAGLDLFGGAPFITELRRNARPRLLDRPLSPVTTSGNHHYLCIPPGPGARPDDCGYRKLTVRERARVQRFPDHHELCGGDTAASRQVGNAVPVNAAHWAARRVAAVL